MTEYALEVNGLTKVFRGKTAVKNVSFQVRSGDITGFLGPNGAGKTTTLRMSLGVIAPDQGRVKLFGAAPQAADMNRIGFLPEERGVYRKMTAESVIVFFARLKGLSAGESRRRARVCLDRFGLADAARKTIKELSKGMAPKIQSTSAVIHEPDFIILDEPFSGLDPVNQAMLEQVIREQAESGRTVLFSTHVMEHAERLCDRIMLMARGRKIFDGGVEEALAHAPRQVILGASDGSGLAAVISKLGALEHLDDDRDGAVNRQLTLNAGVDAQDVLRACVEAGVKLSRFEPKRPHLHDAFVALVGEDAVETVNEEV